MIPKRKYRIKYVDDVIVTTQFLAKFGLQYLDNYPN
jgi:hypothetical protein